MKVLLDIFLSMFNDEVREVRYVLEQIKRVRLDFRLTDNTRTVLELANHIAQIPRIDIGIYSGELSSGELAHEIELKLTRNTIDEVLKVFDDGCNFLCTFFKKMVDEDLLIESLVPFYEPSHPPRSWSYFLPKLITHLVLHKGILWAYLRAAQLDVTMFTYYGSD